MEKLDRKLKSLLEPLKLGSGIAQMIGMSKFIRQKWVNIQFQGRLQSQLRLSELKKKIFSIFQITV